MSKTSVPFMGFQPAVTYLPTYLREINFKPLTEADPEDFHTGDILLLFNTTRLTFNTVIVRYTDSNSLYFSEQLKTLDGEAPWDSWSEGSVRFSTDSLLYKEIS